MYVPSRIDYSCTLLEHTLVVNSKLLFSKITCHIGVGKYSGSKKIKKNFSDALFPMFKEKKIWAYDFATT